MHCFVINLAADTARREQISRRLDEIGLAHTLFDAVDGRLLDDEALRQQYDRARAATQFREMSRGEIGCALSHVGIYRTMVDKNIPHALILEDDANVGSDTPRVAAQLESHYAADTPMVVLLTYIDKYTRWGMQKLGADHTLVKPYGHVWRAHGYFITLAAAKRMLANLHPVWIVADYWPRFRQAGLTDVRAVVPYCISLTNFAEYSNIEPERVIRFAESDRMRSVGYYLNRYVYRKLVYQIFVRPFKRVAKQKLRW